MRKRDGMVGQTGWSNMSLKMALFDVKKISCYPIIPR
jgi:hypothetical protein